MKKILYCIPLFLSIFFTTNSFAVTITWIQVTSDYQDSEWRFSTSLGLSPLESDSYDVAFSANFGPPQSMNYLNYGTGSCYDSGVIGTPPQYVGKPFVWTVKDKSSPISISAITTIPSWQRQIAPSTDITISGNAIQPTVSWKNIDPNLTDYLLRVVLASDPSRYLWESGSLPVSQNETYTIDGFLFQPNVSYLIRIEARERLYSPLSGTEIGFFFTNRSTVFYPYSFSKGELVLNFGPAYGLYHYDRAGGWKLWNTVNPSQMVIVDLNGDGSDELVAAFPDYGLYKRDSANGWQPINTVNPEKMVAADIDGDGKDELVAGFAGYGLYYYDDLGCWSPPINEVIPDAMVRYSDGVICDYGAAYGLWSYNTSRGWSRLNPEDPDQIVAADIDGDGEDELVVSFVGWGLYTYEPEGEIWEPINTAIPDEITAVDIDGDGSDELLISFTGYGLYTYEPEGRIWDPINTEIPQAMILQGNGIAADFGAAYGLWTWNQGDGWQQRNTADPGQMTVVDIDKDSVGELVVSFSGYGLYYFDAISGWQQLNTVVPDDMKPINFYP